MAEAICSLFERVHYVILGLSGNILLKEVNLRNKKRDSRAENFDYNLKKLKDNKLK